MSEYCSMPLNEIKEGTANPYQLEGVKVRIWSGEHQLWWRPDSCGYTDAVSEAGVWMFEAAYRRTSHCGPEKQIIYDPVDSTAFMDEKDRRLVALQRAQRRLAVALDDACEYPVELPWLHDEEDNVDRWVRWSEEERDK